MTVEQVGERGIEPSPERPDQELVGGFEYDQGWGNEPATPPMVKAVTKVDPKTGDLVTRRL
ncbi:hypothetical protein [Pseudarthrobacter sp. PS3-L1]|uniref:hypothetical protein n=1 Tax=Pseudarthrobacter sp. PS3-L1 TaxID=3046207 RepID=UPI0024BAA158|nr:hypothetical protein [Pseudarthrobacter sp. PS3-L1]MDJ0321648.1 hypothetical protein [Pseudarthrobacter sp. PS3-L1]